MTRGGVTTNPGRRSGENEDSVGAAPDRQLWLVADGVGGHGHGAIASGIVRDTLLAGGGTDDLVAGIKAAHGAILAAERKDPALSRMASTVVAVQIMGSVCRIAWVGDSRAYRLGAAGLEQLTVDHSVRQLLNAQGEAHRAALEAAFPDGNVLVRALGTEVYEPSVRELPLRRNDRILLCSDGLTKEVADSDIELILGRRGDPQADADALVSQALANGGGDNVSVIVVDYESPTDAPLSRPMITPRVLVPVAAGIAAALICGVIWYLTRR